MFGRRHCECAIVLLMYIYISFIRCIEHKYKVNNFVNQMSHITLAEALIKKEKKEWSSAIGVSKIQMFSMNFHFVCLLDFDGDYQQKPRSITQALYDFLFEDSS